MPTPQPPRDTGDFAEENAHPGFDAALPIKSGEDNTGPLEGFDPEPGEAQEGVWDRFKRRWRETFNPVGPTRH